MGCEHDEPQHMAHWSCSVGGVLCDCHREEDHSQIIFQSGQLDKIKYMEKKHKLIEYTLIDYSKPKNLWIPEKTVMLTREEASSLNTAYAMNRKTFRYIITNT